MEKTEIKSKVTELIADKLGFEPEGLTEESIFRDDLGCDSLDEIELMMECESEFNIAITDDEVENIKTIGEALILIDNLVNN